MRRAVKGDLRISANYAAKALRYEYAYRSIPVISGEFFGAAFEVIATGVAVAVRSKLDKPPSNSNLSEDAPEAVDAGLQFRPATTSLDSFLRSVAQVSDQRREILEAIKHALELGDDDAVIRHARLLVGG